MSYVLKFSGGAEVADKKLEEETGASEKSGESIFLGFESEPHVEKVDKPLVADSQQSIASKSGGPSVATAESDMGPAIDHLWNFQCPMTKGYNVTSIDWNKTNRVCCPSYSVPW